MVSPLSPVPRLGAATPDRVQTGRFDLPARVPNLMRYSTASMSCRSTATSPPSKATMKMSVARGILSPGDLSTSTTSAGLAFPTLLTNAYPGVDRR
jgi:hypothetical protein